MATHFHLYAELLSNIRQITFYVSQPSSKFNSHKDESTADTETLFNTAPQLSLSDSRTSISVSYRNQTRVLPLPARVSENARRAVSNPQSFPGQKDHEFSLRLQIDHSDPAAARLTEQHDVPIPWPATDLCPNTRIRCRSCGNDIFTPRDERETVWKDLPRADWAEMMDLWHCHKPDPQEGDGDSAAPVSNGAHEKNENVKGYGAANRVVCAPGVVFVDVASFVFAEGDCRGLKKAVHTRTPCSSDLTQAQPQSELSTVLCEACGAHIGEEQTSLEGLKLYKSNVSISKTSTSPDANTSEDVLWETIPVDVIVAAQLLVLIDRTGIRQFVAHSGDGREGVLIWVFNPALRYSSLTSAEAIRTTTVEAQRAMKVFYQPLSSTKLQSLLNPESGKAAPTSLEELPLPKEVYEVVKRGLEASNLVFPLSAREFKEWKTGLLDVYEEEKTP